MAKVTIEDYYWKQKKCEYVLAYYKAQGLKPGDDWKTYEYIQWIQKKHAEFHRIFGLPEDVIYWKGHNEDLLKKFIQFINASERTDGISEVTSLSKCTM